ncbi:hypothetical protein D1B33_13675 [Lysinibacillus yapensis]|uniref:Uncharacterized protein n=1 Tax=Ureibacillus yapensis TaxID=2304605 RepID=A0A396S5C9_9BACL|nr:hypothetical protein [Lysinibacillus yapensis]RHW34695.1 hypothetical protein D1B33_13675 [Lysinibacillus yapensis]
MKLFQVRKGQFVYYQNELHKVYAVKPMFKKSVHLIRLRDLTQVLASAPEIERYQPKETDSFIFNKKIFTLSKDRKAEVGDYILITNPNPDILDHYSLNSIEVVEKVESKGVITNEANGILHNEYLLMVPGSHDYSNPIQYKNMEHWAEQDADSETDALFSDLLPAIGDVYQKNDQNSPLETMVVAVHGTTVYLGNGLQVHQNELMDAEKWLFQYNLADQ